MSTSGGSRGGTPATTVTGPDVYGAAAAVGTATNYARGDHDHGLPFAPAPTLTATSNFISADITLVANTRTVIASIYLAAGTWLIFIQAEALLAATLGEFDISIDSGTADVGGASETNGTVSSVVSLFAHNIVSPAAFTTYTLDVYGTQAHTVKHLNQSLASPCTGITAIKIS